MGDEQLNPVCVVFACMGIATLETDHLLRFSVNVKGLGYRDESGGCDLAICVRMENSPEAPFFLSSLLLLRQLFFYIFRNGLSIFSYTHPDCSVFYIISAYTCVLQHTRPLPY